LKKYAQKKNVEIKIGKILYNPHVSKDLNLDYSTASILFEHNLYKNKKEVSIIIPTYNRSDFLELCILSLFNQDYPNVAFEIIIVDDGSDDNTSEMVRKLKPTCNLKYIYWPRNKPYIPNTPRSRRSAARNIGIKNATGDLLVFMDSDNIAAPDFLKQHLIAHKGHNRLVSGLESFLTKNRIFLEMS
jgi:glycosyltransferase involved in cell wall biosynthesis